MKIIRLAAEAIKKIEVVEITPTGNLITITGKNANGKSSVLDSIVMALAGERHIPWEPVKRGHEGASIVLDLGDEKGVKFRVTRKFTAKDGDAGSKKYTTSLTIEDDGGKRFKKPQELLDTLVGAIAFDPLEWARMSAKDKIATLRGLVTGIDFDAIADERARAFSERTIQNRNAHDAKARASGIIVPPQAPDAPVDTKSIADRLASVGEEAARIERERGSRANRQAMIDQKRELVRQKIDEAAELRMRAQALEEEAAEIRVEAEAMAKAEANQPALPDLPDTGELRAKLQEATELNAAYAKAEQRKEIEATAKKAEDEAKRLTGVIEACDAKVSDAITKADLPVRGLSFDADDVYLNGLPFDQAAESEKLRASMAIAMAENPTLRVLRIKDGSLLDSDAMAILAEVAKADDFQFWIERVEDGPAAIEMVDGRVAKKAATK